MTKSQKTSPLARLLRRFSPRLARLGAEGLRPLHGDGAGALQVLVGREFCLFLNVDARAVPAKQRASFVALEVRRAAPFLDPEHDVAWLGGHAAVWYWSRSRVREHLANLPARVPLRAEACYRGEVPALASDASVELMDLVVQPADAEPYSAGVEARLWRQGTLVSSRWWDSAPTPTQWQGFLRGGGMDPAGRTAVAVPARLRSEPLGGGARSRLAAGDLHEQLPLVATAAGGLVLALFAWQLAGIARAVNETHHLEVRISALEQRLDSVIEARNTADQSHARILSLLELRPPASQLRMLGEVAAVTPGSGWQVMSWSQPGPGDLEVALRGDNLDIAAIVTAWEASTLFQEVTPATGSRANEPRIQARLTPLLEQAP